MLERLLPGLLQAEESALKAGRMQVADGKAEYPVWNHWEFRVSYRSLQQQLCIGGIYVKLLIDGLDKVCVLNMSHVSGL